MDLTSKGVLHGNRNLVCGVRPHSPHPRALLLTGYVALGRLPLSASVCKYMKWDS